jgi:hypothetical protein
MSSVSSPKQTTQFHPTLRRKVVASADVLLQQVQVVDKDGAIRSLIVWRCGTDGFYAESIAALSDPQRLKVLPTWVKEQLEALASDRDLDWRGHSKNGAKPVSAQVPMSLPTIAPAAPVKGGDDDLPDFKSA